MGHSWYLSIDFQLFVLSPFLIYPAWKYGWKYIWTFPVLAFLSSIYIFVMSIVYKIYIIRKSEDAALGPFFIKWIYYPTHARMGPWFLGMTLGYIIHRYKRVKLNAVFNAIMWTVCLSIFAAITIGSYEMFKSPMYNETTLLENAFYLALHRNGWALASAWMIFACHNGTGKILN